MTGPGAPSLQHSPSTSDSYPPPPCALVHLLLGHALVDERVLALRLVLRVVPSAGPSQARAGALGAGAGADRAAAVAPKSRQRISARESANLDQRRALFSATLRRYAAGRTVEQWRKEIEPNDVLKAVHIEALEEVAPPSKARMPGQGAAGEARPAGRGYGQPRSEA